MTRRLTILAALLAVCGVVGWRWGRRDGVVAVAWVEPYGEEPDFV